ncbi:MAG: pseudouridine-5'-phosphate glycosidase [Evtepia gabavorous]
MNQYLDVNPEVAQAVAQGKPVVALESTIISHGMPYPRTWRPRCRWSGSSGEWGGARHHCRPGRPAEAGLTKERSVPGQAGPGSDQGFSPGPVCAGGPGSGRHR